MPLGEYVPEFVDCRQTITSSDKGESRKHQAENINRNLVSRYIIDGNVIKKGNKCDFLVMNEVKRTAYFIELKGSDLSHAVKQLETTEMVLGNLLGGYSLQYRAICSKVRTQELDTPIVRKFKRSKGNAFQHKTNKIVENI